MCHGIVFLHNSCAWGHIIFFIIFENSVKYNVTLGAPFKYDEKNMAPKLKLP